MTDKQAALDAALAQIDRAFGRGAADPQPRSYMKVWMDPFTEEHLTRWIRERVDGWLPDEMDAGDRDMMWESISDDMAAGEHRILRGDPLRRKWPPVTVRERAGLFFRRLFGRWQRTETQITDAEIARACRRFEREGLERAAREIDLPWIGEQASADFADSPEFHGSFSTISSDGGIKAPPL